MHKSAWYQSQFLYKHNMRTGTEGIILCTETDVNKDLQIPHISIMYLCENLHN